jgi:hypothetical protein
MRLTIKHQQQAGVTGWAARRGPVPGVDTGLFRAASLRTQQAPFNALGSPVTVPRSRQGPGPSCRGRGGLPVPSRHLALRIPHGS